MADYTPEQIEALAEFARESLMVGSMGMTAERLGLMDADCNIAPWLRKPDWADEAADEGYDIDRSLSRAEYVRRQAAIIRKHAAKAG